MSVQVAMDAIRNAFESSGDFDELEIDFHGGEPLLAFKEIHEICEWLWKHTWEKPYICFATTNGTLLRGKIKDWVSANHERFVLGLSLDGTPEMHDVNRSKSFTSIDIGFFLGLWPFQPVKMTISPLTLPDLAKGIIYFQVNQIPFTANFAFGIDWPRDAELVLADQLAILNDYYVARPELVPPPFMVLPIHRVLSEVGSMRQCGSGRSMSCIDRNGFSYPCHMFLPSSLGIPGIDAPAAASILEAAPLLNQECERCCLAGICPTCYGLSLARYGAVEARDGMLCRFTRVRARSSASLISRMILSGWEKYRFFFGKPISETVDSISAIGLLASGSISLPEQKSLVPTRPA